MTRTRPTPEIASIDFPADDTEKGFDTLGDVLSVSPTLPGKYSAAAETIIAPSAADPAVWARFHTPRRRAIRCCTP